MRQALHRLWTVVALCATTVFLQAQGIHFETTTFKETLEKAQKENKIVFMDCYTSWCGPCKKLSSKVFPNEEVGKFFNEHFINLKMDMEKGEGPALAKQFRIGAYPTLLFIDPTTEQVIHRTSGARIDFQWLIDQGKKAIDPKNNLKGTAQAYQADKQNPTKALAYFNALRGAGMIHERDKILQEYLTSIPAEKRFTAENWSILESQVDNPYTPAFDYLHQYAADFKQSVGAAKVDAKYDHLYRYAIMPLIRRQRISTAQFPQANFDKLVNLMNQYEGEKAAYYRAQLSLIDHVQKSDYKGMLQSLAKADKKGVLTPEVRFYFIWLNMTYLKECKDAKVIQKGLKWTKQVKPDDSDKRGMRAWLKMKSTLYAAKGDTAMEAKLLKEAEQIK